MLLKYGFCNLKCTFLPLFRGSPLTRKRSYGNSIITILSSRDTRLYLKGSRGKCTQSMKNSGNMSTTCRFPERNVYIIYIYIYVYILIRSNKEKPIVYREGGGERCGIRNTYPAAHSHVAEQILATAPTRPRRIYTRYVPTFMDGFIQH